MHSDVVTDPKAVMVELVSAPITPLAVLRVAKDMGVAHFTVEFKLVLVEDDNFVGFSLVSGLKRLSMQPVELSCGVGRVTASHDSRLNDHQKEGKEVAGSQSHHAHKFNFMIVIFEFQD